MKEKIKSKVVGHKKEKITTAIPNKPNLFQCWKEIMFAQQEFYVRLDSKDKYRESSKFFLKIQAIVLALFLLFFYWMIMMSGIEEIAASAGISSSLLLVYVAILLIIVFPFILLFSLGMLYLNVGIAHLFVLLFNGKEGYAETYKVMAYSTSPNIFAMIPFVNWFSGVYVLVLQVIGIKIRQKLGWAKSIAVIIIPMAIILSIVFILYLKYVWPLILAAGVQ